MSRSVSDITNTIIKIESDNGLFNWQVKGVVVWEILRAKIYDAILLHNDSNASAGKKKNTIGSILIKVKNKFFKYVNAFVYHPYFDNQPVDTIIFESSRKLLYKGSYIDPHTKFLHDDLIKKKTRVAKYQSSFSFDRLAKRTLDIKHLDLVYLISSFRSKFRSIVFTSDEQKKIKAIEEVFLKEFGIKFNFTALVENEVKVFDSNFIFFNSLLKKKQPKEIYIVNFCDKPALITAAKRNGIKVIDIQHGFMSPDDIIYHYPNVEAGSLKYFPDKFYAWPQLWFEGCRIPLKQEDIFIFGNRFLDDQKNNYKHIVKEQNTLLIISQPTLTRQIATAVLNNSKVFETYKILYKLHPAEYNTAFDLPEFKALAQVKNLSFVDKGTDLYELFAASKTVLGVYSAALIEAVSFNCRVMLFQLPGVEMMKTFVEKGHMEHFNNTAQKEKIPA